MALPITIDTTPVAEFYAPQGGPFKSGTSFYIVSITANDELHVYKADSDDPSSGWTQQDTTNNPDLPIGATGHSVHSVLDGTTIHIIYQEGSGDGTDIRYYQFACSSNTWTTGAFNTAVTTAPDGSISFCSVGVRSDGDVVVAYQGAQESNMGSGYDRIDLARREGGTWTADISVDNLGKTTTHMRYPYLVMSANDRAHIFYNNRTDNDLMFSTYLSNNTWGHQHTTIDATVSTGDVQSSAIRFDDGGTEKIRVFTIDSGGELDSWGFDDGDSPTPTNVDTSVVPTAWQQPHGLTVDDATDTQYYVERRGTTIRVVETGSGDDTWGTPENDLTSLTTPFVFSANVYDNSGTVLAYLYLDGSNYRYNERSIAGGTTTPQSLSATAVGTASISLIKTFIESLSVTVIGTATLNRVVTFLKSLGAGPIGTASFLKQTSLTLNSTAIGTATLNFITTFARTLSSTAIGTATLNALQVIGQTLNVTAIGTATITPVTVFARSLSASGIGTATLNTISTFYRTLPASGIGTATLTTLSTFSRTLNVSGIGTATLTAYKTILQTLNSTAIGTTTLNTITTFSRVLAAVPVVTATFIKNIGITLAFSGFGTATLTTVKTKFQALVATVVGTANITKGFIFSEVLNATAIGTATLNATQLILKTLNATAVGTATLASSITKAVTLSANAIGTATLSTIKTINQALSATAIGIATLSRPATIYKVLNSTAVGTATLTTIRTFTKVLNATAIGTANLIAVFIPGGPAVVAGVARAVWAKLNNYTKGV